MPAIFYLTRMKLWIRWRYLLACLGYIVLVFVAVSIFDVILAVTNLRFYGTAVFITTFGVGGVFAAVIAYMQGISMAPVKDETARWSLIAVLIATGALFFFLLSEIEGGEYRWPFKAFGITMAATTLLFMKGKVDT